MGVFGFLKRKKGSGGVQSGSLDRRGDSDVGYDSPEPILPEEIAKPSMQPTKQSANDEVSEELLPIVTLLSHQQQREYYQGNVGYFDNSDALVQGHDNYNFIQTNVVLKGSNLAIVDSYKPIYINICDCELIVHTESFIIEVVITDESKVGFQFNDLDELIDFYSAVLLSKYEYTQLQEAYTGGLLSSEAIHFSDIRTLLDPNNRRHSKEEWCVLRFPYLNGKWIRCLSVIKPNKIEIYLNSNKSKKNLLATILDGKTIHGVYSGHVKTIKQNSLIRVWGDCYIDVALLNKVLANDELVNNMNDDSRSLTSSITTKRNSLSKKLSINSLKSNKSHESLNSSSNGSSSFLRKNHRRVQSIDTQTSESSFTSKTPKKLIKRQIVQTHLAYLIPETHGGIKPVEIMLRMMIPMMNTFELYGRPEKFISSRNEKESLLFGLPQLPNTVYMTLNAARDLVAMNLENSMLEQWVMNDWNMVFKEMLSIMMEKGWKGTISSVKYEKPVSQYDYDPELDFIDDPQVPSN